MSGVFLAAVDDGTGGRETDVRRSAFTTFVRGGRRRRSVAAVLLFLQHRVEFLRVVRVDRQQFVDHLSDGRVFSDPRVRVHGAVAGA